MIKFGIVLFSLIYLSGLGSKTDKIHIGLIVDENISKKTISFAVKELEEYFNSKVHIIKKVELPGEFKKDTINILKFIDHAQKEMPLSYNKHIYLTKRGLRIGNNAKVSLRGFAKKGGLIGVVSTLVVKNESTTKKQYEDLLAKVLIHEMGHLFSLEHCSDNNRCVLVSSVPDPQNFYTAKKQLCGHCLRKIDKELIQRKYHNPNF